MSRHSDRKPPVGSADQAFALGSAAWLAAFNAEGGLSRRGSGAATVASINVATRGAPASAETSAFHVSADDQGRMALAALPPGAAVDMAVDWSDLLPLSGLPVPSAIARASVIRRAKMLRPPNEDTLRLLWSWFARYVATDVRVPDFARFTLPL